MIRTVSLSWGRFGGFYLHRNRVCLGWVALTWLPWEMDDLMTWAAENKLDKAAVQRLVDLAYAYYDALDEDPVERELEDGSPLDRSELDAAARLALG